MEVVYAPRAASDGASASSADTSTRLMSEADSPLPEAGLGVPGGMDTSSAGEEGLTSLSWATASAAVASKAAPPTAGAVGSALPLEGTCSGRGRATPASRARRKGRLT